MWSLLEDSVSFSLCPSFLTHIFALFKKRKKKSWKEISICEVQCMAPRGKQTPAFVLLLDNYPLARGQTLCLTSQREGLQGLACTS